MNQVDQYYFVAKCEKGKYVGLYSVDAIHAMVKSGEISEEYVATPAISGSYCDILNMREVMWIRVSDLLAGRGVLDIRKWAESQEKKEPSYTIYIYFGLAIFYLYGFIFEIITGLRPLFIVRKDALQPIRVYEPYILGFLSCLFFYLAYAARERAFSRKT